MPSTLITGATGRTGGEPLVIGSFPRSAAAQLCDPRLVDAFDNDATNHGTWDRSIAEPPQHDRLDSRGGHVEDAISDVIARKDSPDLSAVGTPPRIVHGDAPATAGLRRRRSSREQRGRYDSEMVKPPHALAL
jgi:hypothetical protein